MFGRVQPEYTRDWVFSSYKQYQINVLKEIKPSDQLNQRSDNVNTILPLLSWELLVQAPVARSQTTATWLLCSQPLMRHSS